jgi:hypothetical protein
MYVTAVYILDFVNLCRGKYKMLIHKTMDTYSEVSF